LKSKRFLKNPIIHDSFEGLIKFDGCVWIDDVTLKEISIIASSEEILCEKLENEFNL